MVVREEAAGGLGEKDEAIGKYRLAVTKSSWDVKHSIGHIGNNVVVTMDSARWVLEISGNAL